MTIPSIHELQETKFDYRLSDFALFSGALPQETRSLHQPNHTAYGLVWTNSLFDHHEVFAMGLDNHFSQVSVRHPMFPHAKHIAVAPRFVNPEANGISATYYQGRLFLTLNGQIVSYPRTMATPAEVAKLTQALLKGQLTPLNTLPYQEYAADHMGIDHSPMSNPYTNYGSFYRFEGKNYALYSYPNPRTKQNQYYWFHCEPIIVERDKTDHALQCVEPLFAASYEPVISQTSLLAYLTPNDRAEFVSRAEDGKIPNCRYFRIDPNYLPLGQYLNTGFMNQLAMSTNFTKLDEIQQAKQGQISQDDFMM